MPPPGIGDGQHKEGITREWTLSHIRLASAGVSIKGDANGFPNFSGCQVYARWWSAGNVNQANSAWMTCASMLSNYPNGYPWSFAAKAIQGVQLCGTFVLKNVNTGQYWGAG